ncbi:MAG: glycosyltransferase family 39 protein [Verrucomicrobiota bacterium]|nr:glycosyltransferase family 39 protein [Verrucomicrobiota bacterium]
MTTTRHAASRLARIAWPVVGWILGAKGMVLLFGLIAVPTLSGKWHGWWATWDRWDALRYLQVAREGYVATGEARFNLVGLPLFPWLVRAVSWLGLNVSLSAFLVSGLASIIAGLLLFELVRADEGEEIGRYAVWFLFIYPTSYFLHIAYTEATLLALTLGCFVAARRQRWWLAGVLGGLASLSRWHGLILLPSIALEAWEQFRLTRRFDKRWLWLGLIPCGFAIYVWVNYTVTGDPLAFTKLMGDHFYRKLAPPWGGLRSLWDSFYEGDLEYVMMTGVAEAFFTLLAIGLTVWSWFALRASYSVWMTVNLLLFLCSSFIQAVPRYTLVMFPIFILFARAAKGRPLCFAMISMPSLLLLALFLSKFVLGHWAF